MERVQIGNLLLVHFIPAERKHDNPLLFVPGMHEKGEWIFYNWAHAAAEAGWEVWIINLRGHHGSRPIEDFGKVSIMDYVEDVEDVLRYFTREHIHTPILIGHSMGGLIVQLVADRNLDIPAVVLTNSAPPRGISPASWATISRYWKFPYLIATALKKPLPPQKKDMMRLVFNNLPRDQAETDFQQMVPESGLAARELTFWRWLGQETKIDPRIPVLVIGATEDNLTPPEIQEKIARKYKTMYKEFPGAHLLPLEQGCEAPIQFILQWAAGHNL